MKHIIIKLVGSYLNVLSFVSGHYAANKALHLFSKPRKGKLNSHQKSFLNKAKQETLNYEGLNIATYHWQGNKTTVLLVHGWESNSARWRQKIKRFIAQGFNIIALDAPAHGASGGKLFNALLYTEFINIVAKKHQPEVIIGHSVGGMAAVFFQQKYQLKSLKKLILLGAPSEFEGILKNYIKLLGYNKKIEKHLNKIIFKRFGAEPNAFSTSKYSKAIETQALIIHDVKDTIIPYADAKRINKSLKNSKLIATTGLGHSLNHPCVTKNVLDFLQD
jgi:pimeloyl-ACP methyl ester carboxylesterase